MDAPRRTVLIMNYEFPPSGGSGVQRIAKFARYLEENGWRPAVIAAEPVKGRPSDETLLEDVRGIRVVTTPARRISSWVSAVLKRARRVRDVILGKRGPASGHSTAASSPSPRRPKGAKIAAHGGRSGQITGIIGIPDFAMLWIGPAVRAAVRVGREERVDAVFASGPPFSVLVAGERVARRLGVPFVADFRDAWRDNPCAWYPTAWHRHRAMAMERRVMSGAAAVTTANPLEREVRDFGGPAVTYIPNGFDRGDLCERAPDPNGPLRIIFMGTVYGPSDPEPVLAALKILRERGGHGADVRFTILGRWPEWIPGEIAAAGLGETVELRPYVPHAEAVSIAAQSDIGLVVCREVPGVETWTPGKVYEYLGLGLPMLFVGQTDGITPRLIERARAGSAVSYSDPEAIADAIAALAEAKATGEAAAPSDPSVVAEYDRRAQAKALAAVLDSVVRS